MLSSDLNKNVKKRRMRNSKTAHSSLNLLQKNKCCKIDMKALLCLKLCIRQLQSKKYKNPLGKLRKMKKLRTVVHLNQTLQNQNLAIHREISKLPIGCDKLHSSTNKNYKMSKSWLEISQLLERQPKLQGYQQWLKKISKKKWF